jgi:hypothetical protein
MKGENAQTVIAGSTNWTMTILCTQANNGLIIRDSKVAQAFRDRWGLLKAAKVTVWFVPAKKRAHMVDARRVINGAKGGILFLFFNSGAKQEAETDWTLL